MNQFQVCPWMAMLDFTPFTSNMSVLLRPVIENATRENFSDRLVEFCKLYDLEQSAINLNIFMAKNTNE